LDCNNHGFASTDKRKKKEKFSVKKFLSKNVKDFDGYHLWISTSSIKSKKFYKGKESEILHL
jgi:hypothetical protein